MSEKLKITVEKIELVAVRRTKRARSFCIFCGAETEMLSPDEIVLTYKIGGGELVALINCGAVHFSETAEGFLLICAASLDQRANELAAETPRKFVV